MNTGHRRRWLERVVRLCLLAWPRRARAEHGRDLTRSLLEGVDDAGGGALGFLGRAAAECIALAASGFALRLDRFREAARMWSTGLALDMRVAARGLRRNPGFSLAAVVTLAVGVGGTGAVLGLVDRVMYATPPYEEPERLALVWNTLGGDPTRMRVAAPDVAVYRERTRELAGLAFVSRVTDGGIQIGEGDAVSHVRIAAATRDVFGVLGVQPVLGRGFSEQDRAWGPPEEGGGGEGLVVVVSHELWRTELGADPGIPGSTVRLDGRPAVVVGVLPPGFRLELPPGAGVPARPDVWVPLRAPLSALRRADGRLRDQDSDNTGVAIARLRPGATFESAAAELAGVAAELRGEIPAYRAADLRAELRPMLEDARRHVEGVSTLLAAGAIGLLLVTCFNIATLVLARGARRMQELTVRLALGSGRWGIARGLALENALLVGLGAAAALVFADVSGSLLSAVAPPALSQLATEPTRTARIVVGAALAGLALVTGLGALPVLRLGGRRVHSAPGVRGRAGGGRVRAGLVVAQVAISAGLMTSGLFLLRSAERVRGEHPGFEAEGALTFSLSLRMPDRYSGPAERARLMHEIGTALEGLPGVTAAGLVGALPLAGDRWTQPYGLPGQARHEWPENRADYRVVTSGLFEALGIRLLEGRTFTTEEDLNEDDRVVVVDERLARRVAGSGTAVGRSLGIPLDGAPVSAQIVGVVERVRYEDLTAFGREAIYVPYRQEASRDVAWVVRSGAASPSELDRLSASVRSVVHGIDPQIPVYDVRTMGRYVEAAQASVRFALSLVGAFALLMLLAASVGVYGIVAYETASRERELGLRMAVGASAADVRALTMRRGLQVGGMGAAAGLVLSGLLMPVLVRIPGVTTGDPLPWLVGGLTALAVSVLASVWPARRVSRLDPVRVLGSE
ncbi:MAG: ABC transporter permease [Longimicrobiales bacterium]|nr:ABC transporter permease [Longimicrobiales bacterium]